MKLRRRCEGVAIRSARAADLPSVIALDASVTGVRKRGYWRELFERSRSGTSEGPILLVAERGGRLDGFILGEVRAWEFGSPACGWVYAVQVHPDGRLVGVGSRLFEEICAAFRRAGVDRVRTMLARKDTLLLSFFRSQGMTAGPFVELEITL